MGRKKRGVGERKERKKERKKEKMVVFKLSPCSKCNMFLFG